MRSSPTWSTQDLPHTNRRQSVKGDLGSSQNRVEESQSQNQQESCWQTQKGFQEGARKNKSFRKTQRSDIKVTGYIDQRMEFNY